MSSNVFPSSQNKPKFNPNEDFEVVKESYAPKEKKPAFNPKAVFEPIDALVPKSAAFEIKISHPKSQQPTLLTKQGTAVSPDGIKAPREFSFDKPYDELAVTKLAGTAREAQKKLHIELQSNDALYEKKLREYRRDSYTIENLKEDYKKNGWLLAPQDEQSILKKEKQKRFDAPITTNDLSDIKAGTFLNEAGSRKFVKDLNKKDVLASLYQVDKFNELANDPDGNHRVEKIKKIAKQIEKGEVVYDAEKKIAVKPLGIIGSIVEGTMNKLKAEEEHDFLKNTENDSAIINELEDQRLHPDTDEPIKVPKGKAQEFLMMAAEMPLSPMIAGALGNLAGPEAGMAAGTAVGAYENRKIQYRATFKQVYNELRDQGIQESEALTEARKQAETAQEIGTIVGAGQGLLGAKIAGAPLKGANFSLGYQQAVGNLLKQNANEFGKILLEGAAQGGIAAGGEILKNKLAQAAGIKRDIDEGTADQFWGNLLMTAGIGAAIKSGRGLTKANYKNILHGLSRVPEDHINGVLQEKVNAGDITQEAADQTLQRINEYNGLDKLIPENVTEDARFKIQDKIQKRNELDQQLESTDKAYHPTIKEKIRAIDEEIIALSKETEKPTKAESGLTKQQEKEAVETAEEFIAEGIIPEMYEESVKKDPIGFWKNIAQQAQNRDENWQPLKDPIDETAVKDQLGDTVVDYAKELFPAPELQKSSISVIQPGEIKQPETITIKPKDNAIPIESSNEVPLLETSENGGTMGEGDAKPEIITGTQEGQPAVEEQSNVAGQEAREVGISHKRMDAIAQEYGLETYEKSPEKVREWDEQAAKKLQEPNSLNDLFTKLRNGDVPDKVETRMMMQYMSDLMAKIEKNPSNELLNQLKRTKDLFNVAGREQGKALSARRGTIPVEESLGDFLIRDMEVNKAPLTEEQKAQGVKEYEEIKAAKDAFEQKAAQLQAENAKLKAEQKVKAEAKTSKPQSKKDYGNERKQIITDIKEKLRKARGETSVVAVPYAKELIAIAPDVAKLVKSYVEQGIKELPELVRQIHDVLKEDIPQITEKDVHNIIAGEYNEKKPSRNQLAQQLYDLKKEARLINELEQLQQGQVPSSPAKQKIRNQKIEKLKEQIKELRDEMGLNDKTDAEKLSALKARYKKQIKELEEKIAKGDFGPDEKPEPLKLDKEAQDLKDKYNELKREREVRLAKEEYENRTNLGKAKDFATNVLNVPRTLMASADFSAPLRQGLVATVSHPSKAAKALPEMFRQAFSQKQFDRWLEDLKESPEYKTMEDSGLYIADPNNLHLSAKEEQYMTNLGEKIPVLGKLVKGSERAYVAYLNKMRADIFNQGVELFESQGKTIENSKELYKGLANYINNSTGRGGLGPLNNAAQILNTAFFSPRLIASRINLLNPLYYTKLPKEVRMMALKDMAKVIAFGGTIVGLAGLAGAEVEKDPRSSDFGKIKIGNTRWDVWGGFQQYIRILSQEITGKTKSVASGKIRELKGDIFPYKSRLDQLGTFFRGKLAPVPGTAIDLLAGRTVVGDEFDAGTKAYELFTPMIAQDIADAWKDKGFASLFTVGVPSSFGVGVSTYETKKSSSSSDSGGSKKVKKINHKQKHL